MAQYCISNHSACSYGRNDITPTRFLSVAAELRIVEAGADHVGKAYAALSHCWGATPAIKRTSCNIRTLKASVDWNELPQNFKDAVIVARKLPIDYLWLDALCILQDSPDDWQHEASRMGDYYRNAYLTISALGVPDGNAEFLTPRVSSLLRLRDGLCWRECGIP
jgi:hypothetical protein